MPAYFLGMISGTSVDGVDAVLCQFPERECRIAAARTFAYPPAIERRIHSLIESGEARLSEIGSIDLAVGRFFGDCASALLAAARIESGDVRAIGHHGQTIWHQPDPPEPFSWQIGDPNSVAAITGIDTVADFRRMDMAFGGQGAPMVPAFHEWLFSDETTPRVILNLGGIANLTVLAPGRRIVAWDTGPANTLSDAWARTRLGQPFDDGGRWASGGSPDESLLETLLDEPYFEAPPPKSTGRERFNETWLKQKLDLLAHVTDDANVAATLIELSARTIADAIAGLGLGDFELIACGGGTANIALMQRLGELTGTSARTTADYGLDPAWVEAAAMAWLARARVELEPGNRPTVTAAREARVLGGLYSGA